MSEQEVVMPSMQECLECHERLPITANYFDRDRGNTSGFKHTCKVCRSAKRDRAEEEEIQKRVRAFDSNAMKALEKILEGEGSAVPHIAELLQRMMQVFGGASGFARHTMNQFLSAAPGSSQRTKMLQIISAMTTKVSELGAAKVPRELMTDEDLEKAIEERTKRMLRIANMPEVRSAS